MRPLRSSLVLSALAAAALAAPALALPRDVHPGGLANWPAISACADRCGDGFRHRHHRDRDFPLAFPTLPLAIETAPAAASAEAPAPQFNFTVVADRPRGGGCVIHHLRFDRAGRYLSERQEPRC